MGRKSTLEAKVKASKRGGILTKAPMIFRSRGLSCDRIVTCGMCVDSTKGIDKHRLIVDTRQKPQGVQFPCLLGHHVPQPP